MLREKYDTSRQHNKKKKNTKKFTHASHESIKSISF